LHGQNKHIFEVADQKVFNSIYWVVCPSINCSRQVADKNLERIHTP